MGFEVNEDLIDSLDGLASCFTGFETGNFFSDEVDYGGFVRFFHVTF